MKQVSDIEFFIKNYSKTTKPVAWHITLRVADVTLKFESAVAPFEF